MQALHIVGYKNSGKTTLLLELASALECQGLRVACIKNIQKDAHTILNTHDTSDTGRMCQQNTPYAGQSRTVLTLGQDASSLIWLGKMDLLSILPLLSADIILMEGSKSCDFLPRILCLRSEHPEDVHEVELKPELALATYSIAPWQNSITKQDNHLTRPHFIGKEDDIQKLVELIQKRAFLLPRLSCGACGHASCYAMAQHLVANPSLQAHSTCPVLQGVLQLQVNGKHIALNPFTQRILAGALGGIVRELKGTEPHGTMNIQCTY